MVGGSVVVAGGYEDDEPGPRRYECIPKSSVFALDPATGQCGYLDDLPLPSHGIDQVSDTPMRTHCAGCLAPDGIRFVVSGGKAMDKHVQFDDDDDDDIVDWKPRRSCIAWSLASGSWEEMPPMTLPRSAHKLLAAGGHLVALGGHRDLATNPEYTKAEILDEAAGRWLKLPLDRLPRGAVACL